MNQQFTQEQIGERFLALPADIKDAISSPEIADALKSVGGKYNLNDSDTDKLIDETGLVMLGLTRPEDYVINLKSRLHIDSGVAQKIAADINEQIFKPIRESLKKIHGIAGASETIPPYVATELSEEPKELAQTRATAPQFAASAIPRAEIRKPGIPRGEAEEKRVGPLAQDHYLKPEIKNPEMGNAKEEVNHNLPTDVKEAIASVEVSKQLQDIGKKHGLHIDTTKNLFDETYAVMRGKSHPKDYIRNLQGSLQIPGEKARTVASDVNEQVFKPIRESLKKIHGMEAVENQIGTAKAGDAAPTVGTSWGGPIAQTIPGHLDRDKLLREIEKPTHTEGNFPAVRPFAEKTGALIPKNLGVMPHKPEDLVQKKLEGVFSLPRQENNYEVIPQEGGRTEKRPAHEYATDPYREPVE